MTAGATAGHTVRGRAFSVEDPRDLVAGAFRIAMRDASYSEVARWSGIPRKRLYDVRDGRRRLGLDEALLLPPVVRDAVFERVLDSIGHQMSETPPADLQGEDVDGVHRLLREAHRQLTAHLDEHAYRIDRAAGDMLERLCNIEIRLLLLLRELGRMAQREAVIGTGLRAVAGGAE